MAALALAAPAAAGCDGLARYAPEVATGLVSPEPSVNNTIPYTTVRRMAGASRAVLLGVTQFAKEPVYDFVTAAEPAPDGTGVCVALRQVSLRIRYNFLAISIASDVRPGSCTYEVTMAHERAHVAYEHGAVLKALHEIAAEVRRPRGHVAAASAAAGREKLEAEVVRWAKAAFERADKVARRGHHYMDIQSNIRGHLAKCKIWGFAK